MTLTEQLDNLYTTTWQHMKQTAIDNFFDASPFWFWMKDKGKLEEVSGGRFLTDPLVYDENDNITWFGRGGTVKMNDTEFLTVSQWDWRYLATSVVRFGVDDQQNSGKAQIFSLMNSKLENANNALINELETCLFQGSGAATLSIDGLQHLVADDPTAAATVGGIAQNTYSWWRNKTNNMTGVSFATSGVDRMRTMLNDCSQNFKMDAPDIIVTGQTVYEYYEDEGLDYYRIQNNKLADMGFHNISFKGIPMIWSPSCGTRMYFLNTNYLKYKYDPRMFFDMTAWKDIPEQVNDRVAQIAISGSFTTSRRKVMGVIHTIDTP